MPPRFPSYQDSIHPHPYLLPKRMIVEIPFKLWKKTLSFVWVETLRPSQQFFQSCRDEPNTFALDDSSIVSLTKRTFTRQKRKQPVGRTGLIATNLNLGPTSEKTRRGTAEERIKSYLFITKNFLNF